MGKTKVRCTKIEKKLLTPLAWYEIFIAQGERVYLKANSAECNDFLELNIIYTNDHTEFVASFKEWIYCIVVDAPPAPSAKVTLPPEWGNMKL